ncbi:hypothetical protein L0665_10155 [Methanogenium marinum]|uniref:Uncharacterized protein n=1 Tax=Methanogenium marinum TaxID=348610 RepID=A0A9Q4KUL7_9EURY|nr:hypothetical protein [Methanogenium marinum]MDE4908969.1 hypothetical protein [Methanogenium marinum]
MKADTNADADEIRKTLSLLFSEGTVVELRALGNGGVHSGYFTDHDALATRAAAMDTNTSIHGIYVTLNEVNPALLSRRANRVKQHLSRNDSTTADADIIRRRWLPIDFDPVRPSGVSTTDEEHDAALRRAEDVADWLSEKGFPAPVLSDSGNGAHLLYRIDLPNDGVSTRLVKECLTVLDAFFSDDTVLCDTANFNAGRIWKLYGTTARKGDNTGVRPHRKARIVSAPDEPQVVTTDLLRTLVGCIPRSAPAAEQGRRRGSFDLRYWLETNKIAVKNERLWQGGTLFSLAECPFSSAHTDGAFAIQFSNGAIFAGCHHNSCGGGTQRWKEFRGMYEPERAVGNKKGRTKSPKKETPNRSEEPSDDSFSTPSLTDTSAEQQEYRKRALDILTTGDPLAFLLDVFHRDHVGDQTVAECLAMSVASQSVENTSGLHVAISGNSGKGKSHACNTMIQLLPEEYRLTGTVSDKALFYHDSLQAGTVLLFDDVSLSDDMQEVLKSATSNFRESIQHRTLTTDRQLKLCTIPERCVWWLAKVESIGDDQVMNRMLTVWIDDSKDQDRAVLEHMKQQEAQCREDEQADTDIYVCHEMWNLIKQKIHHVRTPFSPQICFRTANNRRNPAMLFDLIKCHALIHFCQRDYDEKGSLIANRDDFAYARRLFISICNDAGGQETKQTRNEAAALETIMKMGLDIFTVRQLQNALGLSYQQTYRLLHGYTNNRSTYTGILDKCPAVSLIDAIVAEDVCGISMKRREHHFSFDHEMYREWVDKADVWIDDSDEGEGDNSDPDDPDDPDADTFTLSPSFHQQSENIEAQNKSHIDVYSSKELKYIEKCTDSKGSFHDSAGTHSIPDNCSGTGLCLCESGTGENEIVSRTSMPQLPNKGNFVHKSQIQHARKVNKTGERVKTNRRKDEVFPLPGILDHTSFCRSSVSLGHCSICGNGVAVYHSKEQRASICEKCYARLVREWNKSEGVR